MGSEARRTGADRSTGGYIESGGSSSKQEALRIVERFSLAKLTTADFGMLDSRREIRWHNRLAFTRHDLVEIDCIENITRNKWKITEKGRKRFLSLLIVMIKSRNLDFANKKPLKSIALAMSSDESGHTASDDIPLTGEEGTQRFIWASTYERKPKLRAAAIKIHGLTCKACDFSFEDRYGSIGAGFVEVHHLRPISALKEAHSVNPETDLTVLCSNCHRMIHSRRDHPYTLKEIRAMIRINLNKRCNNERGRSIRRKR